MQPTIRLCDSERDFQRLVHDAVGIDECFRAVDAVRRGYAARMRAIVVGCGRVGSTVAKTLSE